MTHNEYRNKRGASCNACKLRKVKCDRYAKLEESASTLALHSTTFLPVSELAKIVCSPCHSRGLHCTFGQPLQTEFRHGKRIAHIQRNQLEVESGSSIDLSRRESTSSQSTTTKTQTPATSISSPSSSTSHIFGVAGLTRTLLDACVRAYFSDVQPCRSVLHPEDFFKSYEAFWQPSSLRKSIACHQALIIAVACLGAGHLSAPISMPDSVAKYYLRERLSTRYQEIFQVGDWTLWYKEKNACDIIEAAYIMSEFQTGCLDEEQEALALDEILGRSTQKTSGGPIWRMSAPRMINGLRSIPAPSPSCSGKDVFCVNPSSHEFAVRAALRLGVNRRSKQRSDCPDGDPRTLMDANRTPITPLESFRRVRVFWSLFVVDTFRCFAKRQSPLIGDDDYDQDLPRWMKRPEAHGIIPCRNSTGNGPLKDYSLYQPSDKTSVQSDPQPGSLIMQPVRFIKFDGLILENILRLVFTIRALSLHFVSPRSSGNGIWPRDIIRAISALKAWKSQLPEEIQWNTHSKELLLQSSFGSTNSSKSTFHNSSSRS